MQINIKYLNRYNRLIDFYKLNLCEGYVERHHIIPKCMGGSNEVDNLVLLPLKAHYLAHYILHKAYPDNTNLAHAFACMSLCSEKHVRVFSSKQYEKMKRARSTALKGKSRPEWVKNKIRKPKSNKENYRKPKTQTHKENISNGLKGKKKSPTHIANMVNSQREYQQSRTKEFEIRRINILNEYAASGMTRKQFAEYAGINYNTLKRYLRNYNIS